VLCGSSHSNFLINMNPPLDILKVVMKGFNKEETAKLFEVHTLKVALIAQWNVQLITQP